MESNNNLSDSIYHFTKASTAINHILPNFELKFGSIQKTNDSRETKYFDIPFLNYDFKTKNTNSEQDNINIENTKEIRKGVKIISFSQDVKYEDDVISGYNLPRMWAQYGEKNKGICLEIDKKNFVSDFLYKYNESQPQFGKINYELNPDLFPYFNYDLLDKIGYENYINYYKLNYCRKIFFEKQKNWEGEQEFRILIFGKNKVDEYIDINKYLRKVILGIDFNEKYLPIIKQYTKDIQLFRIKQINSQLFIYEI